MNKNYLSLAEAAALAHKSEMTIRRLLQKPESKPYLQTDAGGRTSIQEEYIRKVFVLEGDDAVPQRETVLTSVLTPEALTPLLKEYTDALLLEKDQHITGLKKELAQKDITIKELLYTHQQLIERNRESNIIIQSLQQSLQQTAGKLVEGNPPPSQRSKQNTIGERLLYTMAGLASLLLLIIIGTIVYNYFNQS